METSIESAKYIMKRERDPLPGTSGPAERPTKKLKPDQALSAPANKPNVHLPKSQKGKGRGRKGEPWADPCLNPKCNRIHPVKDCQETTEDKRKALLKKYYDDKKEKTFSRLIGPLSRDGRWSCRIENKRDTVALGDISADQSAILRAFICSLQAAGIKVAVIKQFNEPLQLDAAIKLPGDVPFTTSSVVNLCITISLPCGPLRLRNVEFLVVDQQIDEILLGRPRLKCLGFDLDSHMQRIQTTMDNADISSLMSDSMKTNNAGDSLKAANIILQYKGLWYDSIEDDPIPFSNGITEGIATSDTSGVEKALMDAVNRARKMALAIVEIQNCVHYCRSSKTFFVRVWGRIHQRILPHFVFASSQGFHHDVLRSDVTPRISGRLSHQRSRTRRRSRRFTPARKPHGQAPLLQLQNLAPRSLDSLWICVVRIAKQFRLTLPCLILKV